MTSLSVPRNAYTDAPELHPNLILGSLQLLFWLFFHPSAWRNHVARIDPDLRPDFCLAELSREQWRNPALRRLLIMGNVVCSLLVGLLVGFVLWVVGYSGENIVFSMVLGSAGGLTVGIVFGLAVSVAVGIMLDGIAGVMAGIAVGIAVDAVPVNLVPEGASGVIFDVAREGMLDLASVAVISVSFSVAISVAGGVAAGVASSVASQRPIYPPARQIGGIIVGVLIGIAVLGVQLLIVRLKSEVAELAVAVVAFIAGTGLAVRWRIHRWHRGMALIMMASVAGSIVFGVAISIATNVASDMGFAMASGLIAGLSAGVLFSSWLALPYVLAERIAGWQAGAVAGAIGIGGGYITYLSIVIGRYVPSGLPLDLIVVISVILSLGLTLAWWRPVVLYPFLAAWNLLLYRADERRVGGRPGLLRWHSAFWDEFQHLSLLGLDDHLVLVIERNPAEGQAAIEYLSTSRQRWAAQTAQIELDARRLERCVDVQAIRDAHQRLAAGELTGPASALLRSFSRVSQDVDAALHQESSYNQRLALSAVEDHLDGLLRELTRSSERYAVRFRPVATQWGQIVAEHVRELAEAVELRQEIDSPYVVGAPLTVQQEIFVGRTDVSARIEGLLLDRRRPPLLLYGQRRMGKTSLLNNLGRLLPSTIVPLFVDLQGPATQASDHTGFLYNIVRGMVDSAERQRNLALPSLPREALADDPFTRFDEWLDQVEGTLGQNTALLALDEFEKLDDPITKGHFDEEAVLGMLRHLVQHRPRFKVLLAGSHTLGELQRWASYLINVQVVHISYLKEDEARQLIERPVTDFSLRYEPKASQRVLDLTRGHPALVQLLCAEIVALKNEQDPAVRRLARLTDVEAAVPEALSHGSFFFADIQQNQVDAAGLALLRFLAAHREGALVSQEALARQFPDELDRALDLLTQRELIEPADGGYRFQVELIRRWFAQR